MEAVGRKLTMISNPFDSNSYDDLTMMMLDHYPSLLLLLLLLIDDDDDDSVDCY